MTKHWQRQRGAMIFLTPLVITTIVLMAVMAIDGARLFALRAEMQSQVNAAASAAADASQACGGVDISLQTMADRALAAAQAQGFDDADDSLTVRSGIMETTPDGDGMLNFVVDSDLSRGNAALVSYSRNEPISRLLPEAILGSVTLETNAAVRKEVIANLSSAGSTLNIDGGLLGYVFGAILDQPGYTFDPTDLESLENSLLRVGDLLDELGVDSVEDMLPLGANELASAIRDVAGASSPVGALAEDLLGANGIETVAISDLLSTAENTRVPGNTQVRTYDLLVSLALNIAREQQHASGEPLTVGEFQLLDLPFIDEIKEETVELRMIVNRPPSVAIGPARKGADGEWSTRFFAPDIGLEMSAEAEMMAAFSIPPFLHFSAIFVEIPLAIDLGGGNGELVSARCARGTQNNVVFGLDLVREPADLGTGSIDMTTGDFLPETITKDFGRLEILGEGILDPVMRMIYSVDGNMDAASDAVIVDPAYPLYCDDEEGCPRLIYKNASMEVEDIDLDITIHELIFLGVAEEDLDETTKEALHDAMITTMRERVEDVGYNLLEVLVQPLAEAVGVGFGGLQASIDAASQKGAQLVENVAIVP